jgi:post-segregation antitoxin (ccd killing protein)
MKRKNITITDEQAEWLKKSHINLSRLVQDTIDEERKNCAYFLNKERGKTK